jgi:hypothetical protein
MLKSKLSAHDFENLPAILSITKTRCTQLIANPASMNADEISKIYSVLSSRDCDIEICDLINDYQCGRNKLFLSEIDLLIDKFAHVTPK